VGKEWEVRKGRSGNVRDDEDDEWSACGAGRLGLLGGEERARGISGLPSWAV
jgi:hypothetical protein